MNDQNKKETAIQNEQQFRTTDEILLNIESDLRLIAKCLEKLAFHGININPGWFYVPPSWEEEEKNEEKE